MPSIKNHSCVEKVILYGSRAKGNYREGSDIDMALVTGEGWADDVLLKIMGDFDDSSLPYIVDISDLAALKNQDLIEHIRSVGKVLYEKSVSS